jgi:hypothetical protein
VGDVVFAEDDPTMLIDGNEIRLSRANAVIFRLLLRNAGRVVPRSLLSLSRTKDKEIYLNLHRRAAKDLSCPIFWHGFNAPHVAWVMQLYAQQPNLLVLSEGDAGHNLSGDGASG